MDYGWWESISHICSWRLQFNKERGNNLCGNGLDIEISVWTHIQFNVDIGDFIFIDMYIYTGQYTHMYFLSVSWKGIQTMTIIIKEHM